MTTLDETCAAILAGLENTTPGPWTARLSATGDGCYGLKAKNVLGPIAEFFADIRTWGERTPEVAFNARHVARCDPDTLRAIIEDRAALKKELILIEEMLDGGQGDDDGPQIMPDFEPGMTIAGKVEACLALLERRRDALEGQRIASENRAALKAENERLREANVSEKELRTAIHNGLLDAPVTADDDLAATHQAAIEAILAPVKAVIETGRAPNFWRDAALADARAALEPKP